MISAFKGVLDIMGKIDSHRKIRNPTAKCRDWGYAQSNSGEHRERDLTLLTE